MKFKHWQYYYQWSESWAKYTVDSQYIGSGVIRICNTSNLAIVSFEGSIINLKNLYIPIQVNFNEIEIIKNYVDNFLDRVYRLESFI